MVNTTRRIFLQSVGVATVFGLAGCSEGGGNDGNGGNGGDNTVSGDDYPTIDEWLTETEIGGANDTYDGNLIDRRDQDSVTIDVGASGNGGNFAYSPSAVVVSTGTEIE